MWEKLKGLKTYLVNGIVGLALGIAEIAGMLGVDWHDVVPYQYVGLAGIALVVLNLFLRSITTTPAKPVLPVRVPRGGAHRNRRR